MRHDPDYCRDWEAHGGAPRFEDGAIPLRVQTEADLKAAADWATASGQHRDGHVASGRSGAEKLAQPPSMMVWTARPTLSAAASISRSPTWA